MALPSIPVELPRRLLRCRVLYPVLWLAPDLFLYGFQWHWGNWNGSKIKRLSSAIELRTNQWAMVAVAESVDGTNSATITTTPTRTSWWIHCHGLEIAFWRHCWSWRPTWSAMTSAAVGMQDCCTMKARGICCDDLEMKRENTATLLLWSIATIPWTGKGQERTWWRLLCWKLRANLRKDCAVDVGL